MGAMRTCSRISKKTNSTEVEDGGRDPVARLREIAVATMMEGTAHDRLQRALRSKAGTPGQQLELKPGDLVDVYRAPYTKDHSGWLGPATVVNTTEIDKGSIDVKWQSRVFSVSIRHVRRAWAYECLGRSAMVERVCC